jgi:DnaJ-class molecular chaperone
VSNLVKRGQMVECFTCQGARTVPCATCGGEGAVGRYSPDPEWNERDGCGECEGTGRQECDACDGTGEFDPQECG